MLGPAAQELLILMGQGRHALQLGHAAGHLPARHTLICLLALLKVVPGLLDQITPALIWTAATHWTALMTAMCFQNVPAIWGHRAAIIMALATTLEFAPMMAQGELPAPQQQFRLESMVLALPTGLQQISMTATKTARATLQDMERYALLQEATILQEMVYVLRVEEARAV